MIKKLFITAIFVSLSFSTFAQENSEMRKELLEYVKAMAGNGKVMKPYIDQMAAGLPDRNKEAFKSEINAEIEDMYSKQVDSYIENVSQEDLKALIEFYNTEAGKNILKEFPKMLQKNMAMTQELMMKFQQIYQDYSVN